ncbi:MAG: hypothetical protein ACHQNA_01185 [Acidimicrobiales bacterium]
MGKVLIALRPRAFMAVVVAGAIVVTVAIVPPAWAGGVTSTTVPCNETALETAITTANANTAGGTISLTSGCVYSLHDSDNLSTNGELNGLPLITNQVTINGNGATIKREAHQAFRIFEIGSTGNLVLNHLSVRGGKALVSSWGGGIYVDSGGVVTLNDVTLSRNEARTSGPYVEAAGGGIYVAPGGSATIMNSEVAFNTSTSEVMSPVTNGGSGAGGLFNLGTMTVVNSRVQNNTTTCTGYGCFAQGGGIWNGGTFSLQGGSVDDNDGTMTLTNGSRISANTAVAPGGTAFGGGLYNDPYGSTQVGGGSDITLNTASATGGTASGGGIYNANSSATAVALSGSLVVTNQPDQCAGPGTPITGC